MSPLKGLRTFTVMGAEVKEGDQWKAYEHETAEGREQHAEAAKEPEPVPELKPKPKRKRTTSKQDKAVLDAQAKDLRTRNIK